MLILLPICSIFEIHYIWYLLSWWGKFQSMSHQMQVLFLRWLRSLQFMLVYTIAFRFHHQLLTIIWTWFLYLVLLLFLKLFFFLSQFEFFFHFFHILSKLFWLKVKLLIEMTFKFFISPIIIDFFVKLFFISLNIGNIKIKIL